MKLLLDENLPESLCQHLAEVFPLILHIRQVGMVGAPDSAVWEYALKHGFTVVSKDSDFVDRALMSTVSGKVIWIRLGNSSTANLHLLLRNRLDEIRSFSHSSDAILEIPR